MAMEMDETADAVDAAPAPARTLGRGARDRWRVAARRAIKVPFHWYLDCPTRLAALAERAGAAALAEHLLWRLHCASPYDRALGERLADLAYDRRQQHFPLGTVERGRFLMAVLERSSFATARVVAAYFENLHALLRARQRRTDPGTILLGMGTGRCGSTSLAAILHSVPGGVSTHENPPFVFWEPRASQIDFHLRRFGLFRQYFPLVTDVAHWWINLVDPVFQAFPGAKAIGLRRDIEACVQSWMTVSQPDINHFAPPYNHVWHADRWDPLYPHYDPPAGAKRNPETARRQLVQRYVTDYNDRLERLAARHPDRILLVATERLDLPATRRTIADFIGLEVGTSKVHRNVGVDFESPSADERYF